MLWDIFLSIGYIAILVFCWRLPGRLNRLEEKEEASTKQISELEEQLSHFTKKLWKVDSQSLNVGLLTFTELQILAAQGKVTKQTLLLKIQYEEYPRGSAALRLYSIIVEECLNLCPLMGYQV